MSGPEPSRLRSIVSLLRWFGPWTRDTAVPPGITRERWVIREGVVHGPRASRAGQVAASEAGEASETSETSTADEVAMLDAYVYTPRRAPVGTYVVSPGLHFQGPDDPRFDRFCRVLAAAGFVVVAPFLPAYVCLRIVPSAVADFEQVVEAAHARFAHLGKPALFSISFGSWPALEVAARRPELIDGLITFGGYADFESVARFCVDGVMHDEHGAHAMVCDPLNRPALFTNIARFLDLPDGASRLEQAWTELCHQTWGKMELKEEGRLAPFIDALAETLPESERALFRLGAAGLEGSAEVVEAALRTGEETLVYLSPHAALASIECPVFICHGRDDDVIPWGEAMKLHRALAHTGGSLMLTGLYAHTGAGRIKPADLVREVKTLLALARTIGNGGNLRMLAKREA